ncbi:hypothetical protein BHE74_00047660 [Ensete ventricosum]|nr:hypothetical protein BHE74_00047660 [Ensete ventricosum]
MSGQAPRTRRREATCPSRQLPVCRFALLTAPCKANDAGGSGAGSTVLAPCDWYLPTHAADLGLRPTAVPGRSLGAAEGWSYLLVVYIKAKSSPPGPYGLLGAALAIVAVFGLHCLLHPPFTVPHFLPLHPPFARRLRLHLPTILNHASGLWAIFPWSWQRKNPRSSRDFDDGTIRSFPLVDPIGSRGSDMAQPFVKKDDDLDEEGGLSTLFDPSLMFFYRISGFLLDFVVVFSQNF